MNLVEFEILEQFENRVGAHSGFKDIAESVLELAVFGLVQLGLDLQTFRLIDFPRDILFEDDLPVR